MKIVSWNANCKSREKYKEILNQDADIYVIQECENPATCKDSEYAELFKNAFWAGTLDFKGLMVFTTRPEITLTRLDWGAEDKRVFIPVRVNNAFTLVGAWACDPYCEELHDWIEAVDSHLTRDTIIIGDLNSNYIFDPKPLKKNGKTFAKCLQLLSKHEIEGTWHRLKNEEHGKESTPTFYLYRHLDKPFHIDHCLASVDMVTNMVIHARYQWLILSDHLPIEIEVNVRADKATPERTNSRKTSHKFKAVFHDGTIIEGKNLFDSYLNILTHMGLPAVEEIAAKKRYTRLGCPLVSKIPYEEIIKADGFSYFDKDGYYFVYGISPDCMLKMMKHVAQELSIEAIISKESNYLTKDGFDMNL